MLFRNQVGVGLTRSTINPMLPSLFTVKGASELRLHSSNGSTGQRPWLRPG